MSIATDTPTIATIERLAMAKADHRRLKDELRINTATIAALARQLGEPAELVPAGQYLAQILTIEEKPDAAGDEWLILTWQILGGMLDGRRFHQRLHHRTRSGGNVIATMPKVQAIISAAGVYPLTSYRDLCGRPVQVTIRMRTRDGILQNEVVRVERFWQPATTAGQPMPVRPTAPIEHSDVSEPSETSERARIAAIAAGGHRGEDGKEGKS